MSSPDSEHQSAQEEARLAELEGRFLKALAQKDQGDFDRAEDTLRALLRVEPRLAEPHLELSRILLDTDRLDEAEIHAREGVAHLEAGGQWTDELPENVLLAVAQALLAEILRRRAEEDDVIFGDPDRFHALIKESRERFERAASLDPSDQYASYHAFFLGADGHRAPAEEPEN